MPDHGKPLTDALRRPDPAAAIAVHEEKPGVVYTLYCNRLERTRKDGDRLIERRFLYFGGLPESPGGRPAWGWGEVVGAGIVTLIAGAAAFVIMANGVYPRIWEPTVWPWIVGGTLAAAVVTSILAARHRRRNYWRVFSIRALPAANATVPDFYITDREGVADFLASYTAAHRAWQERRKALFDAATGQGSDAETLRQFAALRDDGILDEAEFAQIKNKIVGGARRSVGFRADH